MSANHQHSTRKRHSGATRTALAILLVVVVAGVSLGVARRGANLMAKDAPATEKDPVIELAAADIATVSRLALSRELPVTGSLSPLVQSTLKAQVPGEVLEVAVREGQAVHAGDVLVRIDTRNLRAQLDAQEAALEKARADLALSKLNRDNSAAMLKGHFISQNAFDTAESTYQANLANVKAADAQLSLARIALDYATVKAPFDGTISQRLVEPGEKVDVDSSLLTVVDLSHMELEAPAPDYEVPAVHIGQTAKFKVGGFGDRQFVGRVERINPMTNTGSRSIMLYLSVDNPEGVLKGGMFAQGELILDATAPVATIPLTALHSQAGLPYVFSIQGSKVVRRDVKLGLRSEERNLVEVQGGLEIGDRVVSGNLETVREGASVVIASTAPENTATTAR